MADSNESFTFSFPRAIEARKDVELQIAAFETRIDKLVRGCTLADNTILTLILHMSHDVEELERLARGLDKIAKIISDLDELKSQRSMIDLVLQNPDKLKGMFGSFSHELDSFLNTTYKADIDQE